MPYNARSYLVVAVGPRWPDATGLAEALRPCGLACVLLQPDPGLTDLEARLTPLVRAIQSLDIAALIASDAALALSLAADGVHLPPGSEPEAAEQSYRHARTVLGADRIVGTSCGLSRHDAMLLAELGADYVALGGNDSDPAAQLDMIAWWSDLISIPCVAWAARDVASARRYAHAGADFVASNADGALDPGLAILKALGPPQEAPR